MGDRTWINVTYLIEQEHLFREIIVDKDYQGELWEDVEVTAAAVVHLAVVKVRAAFRSISDTAI